MEIYNQRTNQLISSNVEMANTYFKRLKGLMFKRSIPSDFSLIITPCNSIHMFFMRFPLDILFVNKENQVVGVSSRIKPWRLSKIYFKAHYVIEMNAGTIERLNISKGDILFIKE